MNKNIIKSLRRTLLFTVVAAVSIGFTACSEDTFVTQNATIPANGYKVVIPSNMSGGDTRAISYNSVTGGYNETFELTDRIQVYKKKLKSWSDNYLNPNAEGKSSNLIGQLNFNSSNIAVDDELMLFYKNKDFFYNIDFSSNTTLADYSLATVKITSINDGVITTSTAYFKNLQSVYKINFTGLGSALKIKKMIIQSEKNKLVSYYYPNNIFGLYDSFGSVNYIYQEGGTDQHELTFLLRFANNPDMQNTSGDVIIFRALGSDGHYYSGTKTVTNDLENCKFYQANVAMTDAGLAMTLTNTTTGQLVELGQGNTINSKDAAYSLANSGYENSFEWYGGENALTLKNVSLNTSNNAFWIVTDNDNIDGTKNHYLILDGLNTLGCSNGNYSPDAIAVRANSSLRISATSADSKLNITNCGFGLDENSTATIESGEVYVGGYLNMWANSTLNVEGGVLTVNGGVMVGNGSSCVISKGGKVRFSNSIYVQDGFIKAADNYALIISKDGDYSVYTVVEDDGSGIAKSIVVTPATATLYYDSYDFSGIDLNVSVYPENTKNKSVTWKTKDPNVVVVDENGNVRATGVGVTTVTATTNDGSNLSSECVVTVKPLGGIWYENHEVSMTPESLPFINPLTIKGKGITNVVYSSSNESVAKVNTSTGEVTIVAGATAGQTVEITATATVTEDSEYLYPEYHQSDSYTITLLSSAGQGNRNNYTPGSW